MHRHQPKTKICSATVIIPTLNEQDFIHDCVMSLIEGTSKGYKIEVLVIDGGSQDNTIEIAELIGERFPFVKVIKNPKKIVPSAINLGAEQALYEFLIWCGAHATYAPGYIEHSLRVHEQKHCSSSGGIVVPVAKTVFGKSIAIATSSKFGVGGAAYRHAKSTREANSVFGGCFSKANLNRIGGLNEKWVRNQDVELNYRLRKEVGPIILDPKIICRYYCRETLPSLWNQYYQYGYWRLRTGLKFPNTFSAKLSLPVGLTITTVLAPFFYFYTAWALLIPGTYLMANIITSVFLAARHRTAILLVHAPIIFLTLHYSWGVGFSASTLSLLKGKMSALIRKITYGKTG